MTNAALHVCCYFFFFFFLKEEQPPFLILFSTFLFLNTTEKKSLFIDSGQVNFNIKSQLYQIMCRPVSYIQH